MNTGRLAAVKGVCVHSAVFVVNAVLQIALFAQTHR